MNAAINHRNISLADQLAAAQQWWRDAGVDQIYHDETLSLLGAADAAKEAKQAKPETPAKAARLAAQAQKSAVPAFDIATLPQTREGFQQWWIDPGSRIPGADSRRIAPLGPADAELMLLIPMPEASDRDTLLSGPQGVLLRNVLRALGLSAERTYFASALPSHMKMPDWADLDRSGLGAITRHHIALVKPAKVLAFGDSLAQVLGLDARETEASLSLSSINVPLLVSRAPEHLLNNARQRARLWNNLLQWTQTE